MICATNPGPNQTGITALECESQRRVGEINVIVLPRFGNKRSVKEPGITCVNADIAIKLPVHLQINFTTNRAGIAPVAGSQDASR